MEKRLLKDLKKGDFFILKPCEYPEDSRVYVRGEYDKASKTYSCTKFTDTNAETFRRGTATVYTGFTF